MSNTHLERARDYWKTGRPHQAGKLVHEHTPKELRAGWAGNILDLCRRRFPPVREVDEVYFIACDPAHWARAKESIDALQALARSGFAPFAGAGLLFQLAEDTARVVYLASGEAASYDPDAGGRVAAGLQAICGFVQDPEFAEEARRTVLREYDED